MIPLCFLRYINPCKFWVYTETVLAGDLYHSSKKTSLEKETKISKTLQIWERKLLDYDLDFSLILAFKYVYVMLLISYFNKNN